MLVAGFKENTSERIVQELDFENKLVIDCSLEGIEKFLYGISYKKPDRILILGEYSGKDSDKLRIETFCTNKFRNKIDGDVFREYPIPYFIMPTSKLKLAKGIGNSWCNLVSYRIVTTFPNLPYTFIHVPRNTKFVLDIF